MSESSSNDDLPPKKPRKDANGLHELSVRLEKLHVTPPAKTKSVKSVTDPERQPFFENPLS